MANCSFVLKHSWLPVMNLRITPVIKIIGHETFAVVQNYEIHKSFLP